MTNFVLSEFTESDTALRSGIDNTPPPAMLAVLEGTMEAMEYVRTLLGNKVVLVSSGYRCEALERVLCAKDFAAWCAKATRNLPVNEASWAIYFSTKAHPKGYAVDFKCPSFGTPAQIVAALRATNIRFDQLICEGTWVHISFAPAMRMMVMNATFNKDGEPTYAQV